MTTSNIEMTPVRRAIRPGWLVLAATEARLILRNRTVALSATIFPLGIVAVILVGRSPSPGDGWGGLAALQLTIMLIFSVYLSTTMALVARRQQLYLKRLRSSPASTATIIAGLTAPPLAVGLLQAAAVQVAAAAFWGQAPVHPELVALAAVGGGIMCVAFAFLTAAYTKTPEAAQMTTVPLAMATMGGLFWTLSASPGQVGLGQLAVPGGAIAQIARLGWEGPAYGVAMAETLVPAVGFLALIAVAACAAAARLFRWEPRD